MTNVLPMQCPVCAHRDRRKPGDGAMMHSMRELDVCEAIRQGVSIEEIERRRVNRPIVSDTKEDMIVEEVRFDDGWARGRDLAAISIQCDTGTMLFSAQRGNRLASKLPVPPLGMKLPNTFYGVRTMPMPKENYPAHERLSMFELFRKARELQKQCDEQLEPLKKSVAEIRMLHLPPVHPEKKKM